MERGTAELQIILLGDLIDRGPNSAGVVQRAADLAEATGAVRFLKGNHEEVFLQAAKGVVQATRFLFRFGGRETMFSYALSEAELDQLEIGRQHVGTPVPIPQFVCRFLLEKKNTTNKPH